MLDRLLNALPIIAISLEYDDPLSLKLIKLVLSCEEIQMEKFFIEYFDNLTIYDK